MPPLYTAEAGSWTNARGQTLYTLQYEAANPRAAIFFHHGYSEYLGWYKPMFTVLAEAGLSVYGFDMHSHGRSEPLEPEHLRATVRDIDDCVGDVMGYVRACVLPRTQGLPLFAFGHSVGGGIVSLAECENPGTFAGIALNSPCMGVVMDVMMHIQKALAGLLNRTVPFARIVPEFGPEKISDEESIRDKSDADPLKLTGKPRLCTAVTWLEMFARLDRLAPSITCPIYVQWATLDEVANRSSALAFVAAVSSPHVLWQETRGGAVHAYLHGRRGPDLFRDVAAWIDVTLARELAAGSTSGNGAGEAGAFVAGGGQPVAVGASWTLVPVVVAVAGAVTAARLYWPRTGSAQLRVPASPRGPLAAAAGGGWALPALVVAAAAGYATTKLYWQRPVTVNSDTRSRPASAGPS